MRVALALVPLFAISTITAAEPNGETPIRLQVGGTYLTPESRTQIGKKWGAYVGLATPITDERGFFGWPSGDIDARYVNGEFASLLSMTACYTERFINGKERFYFGVGVGGSYNRLSIRAATTGGSAQNFDHFGYGGKALVGYIINDRAFIEGSYFRTPEISGIETRSMTIGIGYWF